jgi:hypothetical protein
VKVSGREYQRFLVAAVLQDVPIRRRDMDDIIFLAENYKHTMDRSLSEEYAGILKMEELYEEICGKR